ncbi:hypothetical protein FRACYDRAFT_193202 [Fragilariopsis cylindrus CCMP1102]|uniref:Uncharacterized protein n=1 Tax=Fragilariopsis cylindrus CCMP1102 TaxID=635003 RepID=A0A1E7EZ87_9STRA|nr:hypothetical protein FRACYDRAFT_193202 [Fragilariopsis cylindrus CCMP1102]|eukprot:OEU11146.1 hypothetical protein FRACYDRAFT_193202 [Fragilariopsis cylindrus CCMP1102]
MTSLILSLFLLVCGSTNTGVTAFHQNQLHNLNHHPRLLSSSSTSKLKATTPSNNEISRQNFFSKTVQTVATAVTTTASVAAVVGVAQPKSVNAIGPVKINLLNPTYTAIPCPKDRPIPGEKAMKGMRGLCVTVAVDLEDLPKDPLEKVGVYGYVTDTGTGESVLANNPDGGTDSGQFAMIESITTTDKKIQFEFIAAVPSEQDLRGYEAGIAPINFKSLRVVSFPGGQQYGAINPCEMNEFSDECDVWEAENGQYEKKEYMIKSNERTKGR